MKGSRTRTIRCFWLAAAAPHQEGRRGCHHSTRSPKPRRSIQHVTPNHQTQNLASLESHPNKPPKPSTLNVNPNLLNQAVPADLLRGATGPQLGGAARGRYTPKLKAQHSTLTPSLSGVELQSLSLLGVWFGLLTRNTQL